MLTNHACDSTSFYSISSRLTHAACKSISFGKNQSDHLFWGFNEDPSRRMPEEIRSMWLTPKRKKFWNTSFTDSLQNCSISFLVHAPWKIESNAWWGWLLHHFIVCLLPPVSASCDDLDYTTLPRRGRGLFICLSVDVSVCRSVPFFHLTSLPTRLFCRYITLPPRHVFSLKLCGAQPPAVYFQ
jgi:hypothetical protein